MAKDIEKILITEEEAAKRIKELGEQISRDYAGQEIVVICVLRGASIFFADLCRAISVHMKMDFMAISSYGDAQKTSGIVKITKDADTSITGKHVLVVEDIMDSGYTLKYLCKILNDRQPASVKVACLLDKPSRREVDITPDYCCFTVPNEFVVGFGLDYKGLYRNLPYIGVLKPEVYAN
ncbi:MAG: hypoxanthine phosphoribosyltransferase [Clostridia bacterium]|nr:hypoxanthine phosphoribosyltransferase [Clostridia bacterium]